MLHPAWYYVVGLELVYTSADGFDNGYVGGGTAIMSDNYGVTAWTKPACYISKRSTAEWQLWEDVLPAQILVKVLQCSAPCIGSNSILKSQSILSCALLESSFGVNRNPYWKPNSSVDLSNLTEGHTDRVRYIH